MKQTISQNNSTGQFSATSADSHPSDTPIPARQTPHSPIAPVASPQIPSSASPTPRPNHSPAPASNPLQTARNLLTRRARNRRFRSDSLLAQLTSDQRLKLIAWLYDDTIDEVVERAAAPPPEGFGRNVSPTTLTRLRKWMDSNDYISWFSNSMDVAFDMLNSPDISDPAPIREALSLLLHSRALFLAEEQAPVGDIDKLLSAIARLERLKSPPPARRSASTRPSAPLTTHHHVELTIRTAQKHEDNPIISVHATPQIIGVGVSRPTDHPPATPPIQAEPLPSTKPSAGLTSLCAFAPLCK